MKIGDFSNFSFKMHFGVIFYQNLCSVNLALKKFQLFMLIRSTCFKHVVM